MKVALGLLLAVGAVAALALFPGPVVPEVVLDTQPTGSIARPNVELFHATLAGGTSSCGLSRSVGGSGPLYAVRTDPDCRVVFRGLGEAALWRDNADGSISLLDRHRRVIIEFSAGDGVDFESFRPVTPLVALMRRAA